MKNTLLVTGCAGFIGSQLTRVFLDKPDAHVIGIDNFDPMYLRANKQRNIEGLHCDRFEFHELDICDHAGLAEVVHRSRPDAVVHLAALAGVRPSIAEPRRYADVNVTGTLNLLDCMRSVDCRKLVFASSSSVYGSSSTPPFREEARADEPISPYAATKRAGELICSTYSHLFGFRIACLRFFTVFGPRQRPDLAIMKFMQRIASGQPIEMFGNGSTSRDYTYIDDIVAGIVAANQWVQRESTPSSRAFNLGGNRPIALTEMIQVIESVVGKKAVLVQVGDQAGDVETTCADLTRSESELGYRPRVNFREGVERQWNWFNSEQAHRSGPPTAS